MKIQHKKADFDWGSMVWLIDDDLATSPGLSLAKMTVNANSSSEAHSHSDCTETIHVLSGQIRQRRGDAWIELAAGETTFIPAGLVHQTQALGFDPAALLIAYSSGSRSYQSAD